MNFVLDTNVLSELRKSERTASPAVRAWISARVDAQLYLSVVTVLEIEVGIGRIERRDRVQADRLRRWLDDEVLDAFRGRILPVDLEVARRAAGLHVPDPSPERDALIAATALVHDMSVVTRNTADFSATGARVINPWTD
ncbi:type II toxin-antitoxin system VapC family toxin [Gordonia sp. FQ]|uniref:type II toxin-antitoxin system VapC family toxin n=1 Tax=Gordonia sp. FQ TaxID=3446634 RepID=UPI003F83EE78